MANRYRINRSNYTIRSRHQLTSGGVVYERDFMTTTNLGAWDSGSIPYGESNFRMLYRRAENVRRKSYHGTWLKPSEDCNPVGDYWTISCTTKTGVTEETSIKLKPNYHSLLDFAYYGSCQELVKSTVRKIIENFPGELETYDAEQYRINGVDYRMVLNPFSIDAFDDGKGEGIKDFVESFSQYRVILDGAEKPILGVTTGSTDDACEHGDIMSWVKVDYQGGSLTIYKIIYDSEPLLFTQERRHFSIRPEEKVIEDFFENLDDFGHLLLNRDSVPIYTATIDWPHDTEYGVKTYRRSFTWPLDGEWNLDIRTMEYADYINEILAIAEFYDGAYTDNLWRMLTHDSIKSMDITFSNPSKNEDKDDYVIGSTKLEGLLWAYGRQFDELKRAIDNIKNTSNITYDESANLPDYFLSDTLELSGWEVYNVDRGLEGTSTKVSWKDIVSGLGVERTYTAERMNNIFLRELKINSKYIFKKKGTRDGIISLLGLFGLIYGKDYVFDEYVATVKDTIEKKIVGQQFYLETLNMMKMSSETDTESPDYNPFDGLPFTYVESKWMKYIIPWFDKRLKYDGDMYFQMKGSWIDETLKYLTVVDDFKGLFSLPDTKAYKGAICFVENIGGDGTENVNDHYFVLRDVSKSDSMAGWVNASPAHIAYIESIIDDFKGNNPHVGYGNYDGGKEYIERIKVPFSYHISADTEDNPMFNELAYDNCNGTYKDGLRTTRIELDEDVVDNKKVWYFGESACEISDYVPVTVIGEFEQGAFRDVTVTGEFVQGANEEVTVIGNFDQGPVNSTAVTVTGEFEQTVEELPTENVGIEGAFTQGPDNVVAGMMFSRALAPESEGLRLGSTIDGGWHVTQNEIDYNVYDFECETYDKVASEAAANSVINTKGLKFTFYIPCGFADEFKNYFDMCILPYLKQMIPSTTIWGYATEWKYDDDDQPGRIHAATLDTIDPTKPIALVIDAIAYTGEGDTIKDDYIANYVESHDSRNW